MQPIHDDKNIQLYVITYERTLRQLGRQRITRARAKDGTSLVLPVIKY